jgi:hypothetical protein
MPAAALPATPKGPRTPPTQGAWIPGPPYPDANRLRPSDGATVIAWCQSSQWLAGTLVGGGVANSGPIVSPPLVYRSGVRLTARCQLWRQTTATGPLVVSQPTTPTYVYILLSSNGLDFVPAATGAFSILREESHFAADLGDYRDKSFGYPGPPGTTVFPGYPQTAPNYAGAPFGCTVQYPPWIQYQCMFIPYPSGDAVLVECVESA